MTSKKITVGDRKHVLGSQEAYEALLGKLSSESLVDTEGFEVHHFESLVDGGRYTRGPNPTPKETASSPSSSLPSKRLRTPSTAPPSSGKAPPKPTQPRKSPSSDEGKLEGLRHTAEESSTHIQYMQCTSTPTAVALLNILEQATNDQHNGALDDKFHLAANHVIHARHRLASQNVPQDIGSNERFFTGAMANALNSVLKDGYCVLHQACLGPGATHSDISAARIHKRAWPATLLVGEGKWHASNLREEMKGQIFNELLRHRAIDQQSTDKEEGNHGPILLLAFDKNRVEIDVAFPSTKGGKLEHDGVVAFSQYLDVGKETFWTIRILRISIEDANGRQHLPIVFRFISEALEKIESWSGQGRVQHKTPMPLHAQNEIAAIVRYCGENTTIVEDMSGAKFVYKEYSYHLRQASAVMLPLVVIQSKDQRHPPPKHLREHLGFPYSEWTVHCGPFGMSVLRYPFIEGSSYNPSITGWLCILRQIKKMHEIDFVHGDLLPRNVLFDGRGLGYVIDFDLSRKEGATYVQGYNYTAFADFRHGGARAGETMTKAHDVHALRQMSHFFFDVEHSTLGSLDCLDELIDFFATNPDLVPKKLAFAEAQDEASGSPNRQVF